MQPAESLHPKENCKFPPGTDALDISSAVCRRCDILCFTQLGAGGRHNIDHTRWRVLRIRWINPDTAEHRADISCTKLPNMVCTNNIRFSRLSTQCYIDEEIRVNIKHTKILLHFDLPIMLQANCRR